MPGMPLVVKLPRDHGFMVPESFVKQCERANELFRQDLQDQPGRRWLADCAAQTVQAFTWFLMDTREMRDVAKDKDEMVRRFLRWYKLNVTSDLSEGEVNDHLNLFFDFMERRRLVTQGPSR